MIEELWNGLIELSSQFVIPDWGQLIALLPVFLAIPVVLFVTWTIYRFATAGPTRRGKRRLPPVAPASIHMPGPSFAPFIAAAGATVFVFGLVVGEIWLLVGAVVLTVSLLYWGREALRDYDHMPSAAGESVVVGMLQAPTGAPPEGVHIPPPSFRPLLVAVAMTILVAGLIIGGWALLVGFIVVVLTGLGWLWDARREYQAVEIADRTGHLDMGGAPAWPKATLATIAVLVAVAALFSSGILPNAGGGDAAAGASAPPGGEAGGGSGGGGGGPAAPSLPTADVTLAAANIDFVEKALTVPAGKPFTLAFDNQDTAPHDVVIKDGAGSEVFKGDVVNGPAAVVYDVPALTAGSYSFVCSIHPNMQGAITAQ